MNPLDMKKFLILAGVVSLLTLTGCLVSEGGGHGHGHGRHRGHATIIAPAPVVVVPLVPVVRVHH
jgi:hypothetical protein